MNKQQLASKIWESANRMRSKIEANEYKDYILGFIFYKYLSDKEVQWLHENDYTDEEIKEYVNEDDHETLRYAQQSLGYFIAYKDLFSTWIQMGSDFSVDNVRTALSSFSRLISESHKKVFDGIFNTLETGLSKLGENTKSQTKAVSDLIQLIDEIPMNGKQDYDVLGFIYEYLISNFAANAGKKAGEFYTPHEVSLLMSEIVANHLRGRDEIKIYDPTSGSGSLLINIGQTTAKYMDDSNRIRYYAQELKSNTYNLTRMNLVMRGIIPDNIVTRNGDTLEEDWPYFDENDPVGTYDPLYVDAVVSNPPYSQRWDPSGKENDPRYSRYGLAPKSKADYAFLLHDLYHLKPDGIMTIVLPHGVLFRGGEEGQIRKNLIEQNNIDAIIGLPANIFFGTGIPTIIMVLRQKRENTDVLIIDASKGFAKEGKNNKLRASDIRRIVDTVKDRKTIEKYSRVVSREGIRKNDYNLNIPRYVDSSEEAESYDIYASMFGGIPESELNAFNKYWDVFPTLKSALFKGNNGYLSLKVDDVKSAILENPDVKNFKDKFQNQFSDFGEYLDIALIDHAETLSIPKTEDSITSEIFRRFTDVPLLDPYQAYEIFEDQYEKISGDLELIQPEGMEAVKKVDPNMVIKKKDNKETEVQEGWKGHILPFELVQNEILSDEVAINNSIALKVDEVVSQLSELMEMLQEDEKDQLLNETNDAFTYTAVKNIYDEICDQISDPDIETLREYSKLTRKKEKMAFIANHSNIKWEQMARNKDGTIGKAEVNSYIVKLKSEFIFDEKSYEYIVKRAYSLLNQKKDLDKQLKQENTALHEKTKDKIESLSDKEIYQLLHEKWIAPVLEGTSALVDMMLDNLTKAIEKLSEKYSTTFNDIEEEIHETENQLSTMLSELTGSEADIAGIRELQKLLGGDLND